MTKQEIIQVLEANKVKKGRFLDIDIMNEGKQGVIYLDHNKDYLKYRDSKGNERIVNFIDIIYFGI